MKILSDPIPMGASAMPAAQHALSLISLDIGRALADRDSITFRAQGTCMYPTVRPGDVFRIQPSPVGDVAVGDIAVCRGQGYLFGHRVIGKGKKLGRAYIITRPDRSRRSRQGNDGPTFDENLLGIVREIKRKGKPVPLQPTVHPWVIRRCHRALLSAIEAKQCLRFRLTERLLRTDPGIFRHAFTRAWLILTRPRLNYRVQVPLNRALGEAVFRVLDPAEFDPEIEWKGKKIAGWTLALHLKKASVPAARATFVRQRKDSWRLAESHVRLRYRGAGFRRLIVQEAENIMTRGCA